MMHIYSKTYESALLILYFLFLIQCPLRGDSQNTQLSVTSGTDFIASSSIVLQNTDINNNGIIITARNNTLYQQQIIRKQNYPKVEHISPEQPYRLNPDNCTEITKINLVDISLELNCISPEENEEIIAQFIEELR